MARLSLLLLGGFAARLNETSISGFTTDKSRAMLAYLAVEQARPHRRQALAGLFWPGYLESSARASLRHVLTNLRQVLSDDSSNPPFLLVEGETIQFNPTSDHRLDVDTLRSLIKDDQPGQSTLQRLERAVELYRGPFLEGFSLKDCPEFDTWSAVVREELQRQVLNALSQLAEGYEHQGDLEKASGFARRQLELEPWLEEAHRQLMRMLALRGQRTAALAQYETCRRALAEGLGVSPSVETERLFEQIRSGEIGKEVAGFTNEAAPPAAQLSFVDQPRPKHNLPHRLSTFIGREKEIDQVIALLRGTRLLTVTGAGGVGKTSLALQAARNLLERYPDGVWWVELAPLSNPELVPQACAQSLEMIKDPNTPYLTALIQHLQKKHLLLIIDNCEHLITACASLAAELLKSCPKLTILATSRELLNLAGESAFRVPSLTLPDSQAALSLDQMNQSEAVRLFVERASQVSSEFSLTQENALSVALICRRLDGIPLAIELAAARARMMTPTQIASRLEDVFHLLTGGTRGVLPRQQTLKATIDWSYNLLSPKERLLLQRLSVFAGGWTLEAAEAVAPGEWGGSEESDSGKEGGASREPIASSEVLDLLSALVDKSIVQVLRSTDGSNRYRILETIRQYARERLQEAGDLERTCDQHLVYFAGLTGEAELHLRGKGQIGWLDRLDLERDNLRSAMEWSLASRIDLGLQIAADLVQFWWIRSNFSEGQDWQKKLLLVEETSRNSQTKVDVSLGYNRTLQRARCLRAYDHMNFANLLFTFEQRISILEESVGLLRNLGTTARRELAKSLYGLLYHKNQLEQSSPEKQEMLDIFQQEGMRYEYAEFLYCLAGEIWWKEDLNLPRIYLEESLAIDQEIEDLDGIEACAQSLGARYTLFGDYEKAELMYRETIKYAIQLKNKWWEALSYLNWTDTDLAQGKYKEAVEHSQKARSLYWEDKPQGRAVWILSRFQSVAWSQGNYEEAYRLGNQILDLPLGVYPDDKAFALYLLGRTALSQKDLDQAERLIRKAIIENKWNSRFIQGAAVLFSLQGKHNQAVRLFSATDHFYQVFGLSLPLCERKENEQALEAARLALGEEAFATAWKEGQALTLLQASEEVIQAGGL